MNYKFLIFALVLGALLPEVVLAQLNYKPLVGIPGVSSSALNFGDYINALYALSISVAALIAVIKIIIAGVKYMLSDVVTSKSEAINDIRGSLIGLVVVISAVLVLRVINPQLAETDIFLDPVVPSTNTPSTVTPGTVTQELGYKWAPQGSVPNFQGTQCTTVSSTYRVAGGKEICFDPLDITFWNSVTQIFNATSSTGAPLFNLPAILTRYQTAHYPRFISNTAAIQSAEGANHVFLAVSFNTFDWLDSANLSSLPATCLDFARETQLNVIMVGDSTKGYLACVDI